MSLESNHKSKNKSPAVLTVFGAVSVLLIGGLILYLGNYLRELSEVAGETGRGYAIEVVEGQTVYVPVYSHIYAAGGEPYPLEATLSIRNSDPGHSITVRSVRYYDTKGQLVEEHVKEPRKLRPLETVAFVIEKQDLRGGSGANFIVDWDADQPVYEPILEAVMVGGGEHKSISFISPGRPLIRARDQD